MDRRTLLQLAACGLTCATLPSAFAASARNKSVRPAPLPPGYRAVAERMGVPPLILYGVALQESKMKFGEHALPYPWTLCVRGDAKRYDSYREVVAALKHYVTSGITNVDCGAMQVNWRWHKERLRTFRQALDPYPNLFVGAQILVDQYRVTGDWFKAVGRYHNQVDLARAQRYATQVFSRIPTIPRKGGAHG